MLIRVMYRNRKYDMVKDFFLANLIAGGRIMRFYRSGGWVEVGRDAVREDRNRPDFYSGPERRDPVVYRPLNTPIRIGRRQYRPSFAGHFEPD